MADSNEIAELRPAGLMGHHREVIVYSNYSKLGEHLRQVTPPELQCSVFCGGRRCKYDSYDTWKTGDMAINGIYSHWVTENILAMARPNTDVIKKKNIVSQFLENNIKTVINLQLPGEHASCGGPISVSGFSYDPSVFMEQGIFYYNFALRDHSEPTLNGILDMVKVMSFSLSEGKVAVHCHAGLGRTGVLIACYLVYSLRVRANDAIRYVRIKRPNAVQTSGQIMVVQEFEAFILPQLYVFCNKQFVKDKKNTEFTLQQYLHKQRIVLHGYEARALKHIPKIIYVICERLLKLCGCCGSNDPRVLAPLEISFAIGTPAFTSFFFTAQFDHESSRVSYSAPLSIGSPSFYSAMSNSTTGSHYQSQASIAHSLRDEDPQVPSANCNSTSETDSHESPKIIQSKSSRPLNPDKSDCPFDGMGSHSKYKVEGQLIIDDDEKSFNEFRTSPLRKKSLFPSINGIRNSSEDSGFTVGDVTAPNSAQYQTRRQDYHGDDVPSCISGLPEQGIDHLLDDGIRNQRLSENLCFQELASHDDLKKQGEEEKIMFLLPKEVLEAFVVDHSSLNQEYKKLLKNYRIDLNIKQSSWQRLATETNLHLLTGLLFSWLEHLKQPVFSVDVLSYLVLASHKPEVCVRKMEKEVRYTLEYLVRFVSRLQAINKDQVEAALRRILASLTQQAVPVNETLLPAGKGYTKLREGTLRKCTEFMAKFYELVHLESRSDSAASATSSTVTCVTPPGQVNNLKAEEDEGEEDTEVE